MIKQTINDALNEQMNKELASAYHYLATSAFFEERDLPGFANFFLEQAKEELVHAKKIFDYIHTVGGTIRLSGVEAPDATYKTPLEAFEGGLEEERTLATEINSLLALAVAENHAPTQVFMQWFVNEQVEEEALFDRCVGRLKIAGDSGEALLLLDREFGSRRGDA